MIKQYRIKLMPENNEISLPISGYSFYGLLTELADSDLSQELHANNMNPVSQYILLNKEDKSIEWVISLLEKSVIDRLSPVIESSEKFFLRSNNLVLDVKSLSSETVPSEEFLIKKAKDINGTIKPRIEFITPTSFKSNNSYQLFPSVEFIFKNLIRRWNVVSQSFYIDDEDAVGALIQNINIAGYNLYSSYFHMKDAKIPAFKGELRLSAKLSLPLMELFKLLMLFAEYSGVGIKTSLGMGAVKVNLF